MNGNKRRDRRDSPTPTAPKAKATTSTAVVPSTGGGSSVSSLDVKANDCPSHGPQEVHCPEKPRVYVGRYREMILEAVSSLQNPLGSDQGEILSFIELMERYRIKDSAVSPDPLPPKQIDVRQSPFRQSRATFSVETIEDAADTTALWIAEAENKELVTDEAFKEADRVTMGRRYKCNALTMQRVSCTM